MKEPSSAHNVGPPNRRGSSPHYKAGHRWRRRSYIAPSARQRDTPSRPNQGGDVVSPGREPSLGNKRGLAEAACETFARFVARHIVDAIAGDPTVRRVA